jgi:hypothetical protein
MGTGYSEKSGEELENDAIGWLDAGTDRLGSAATNIPAKGRRVCDCDGGQIYFILFLKCEPLHKDTGTWYIE